MNARALMGSRTQVKLSAQVEALARVLLGLSRGRRGLARGGVPAAGGIL